MKAMKAMKKFFPIFLYLFACAGFVTAQSTNDNVRKDNVWKNFSGANEEFVVEFPELYLESLAPPSDKDEPRLYKAIFNKTYFFISSCKNAKISPLKQISALAERNQAKSSKITINPFSGEAFDFVDSEGFHQKIVIVETNWRLYIFHTASETKISADVERFFKSIKFQKTAAENQTPQNTEDANQLPKTEKKNPLTELPQDVKDAVLKSMENGIGGSSNQTKTQPTGQTSGIKILSKPKAKYTDLARFYWIQGNVSLKVTFLADSTVGSIQTVSKLPFGLTASAVEAAKSMRFEPAKKNDVAYSVTKMVVYSFTIY
jgi:hypothetical protein